MSLHPPTRASQEVSADSYTGEFPFTVADFTVLAEILRADSGIVVDRGKMPLIYARLAKRVRALGLSSFKAYCEHVAAKDGAAERQRMVEALTTNVTRFFREPHHFEHLKSRMVPRLAEAARAGKRIRLWSAGCSTGEEPYSIALTLLTAMPNAAQYDIKILATDIDTDVLRHGREGLYTEASIAQVDPLLRRKWFAGRGTKGGEELWEINPAVRALVTFRSANLIGAWPMNGPFQVVFCRNTVIYFDDETRTTVWKKMNHILSPGGHLYIGHSERMPIRADFMRPVGPTIFQRSDKGLEEKASAFLRPGGGPAFRVHDKERP